MRSILLALAFCLALTPLEAASRKSHPAKILKPKRNKYNGRRGAQPKAPRRRSPNHTN